MNKLHTSQCKNMRNRGGLSCHRQTTQNIGCIWCDFRIFASFLSSAFGVNPTMMANQKGKTNKQKKQLMLTSWGETSSCSVHVTTLYPELWKIYIERKFRFQLVQFCMNKQRNRLEKSAVLKMYLLKWPMFVWTEPCIILRKSK